MPDKFERHTSYKIFRVKFSRLTKDMIYKLLYNRMINGNFKYYWLDPDEYKVNLSAPGTVLTPEQQTASDAEEFENEFIDLEKRQVGDLMVVAHPDEENAHDDHPDATALINYAVEMYNNSDGIFQYYAERNKAKESAEDDVLKAIAEANEG